MKNVLISWGALALILSAGPALAEVPQQIHYQGMLTTGAGDPIQCPQPGVDCPSGAVNMVFRIYTELEGGQPVWSETHSNLAVTNGVVDVHLGEQAPIGADWITGSLFLGVELNGTGELAPRQSVVASAFSLRAAVADSIGGITAADVVTKTNIAGFCVTQDALDLLLAESQYLDEPLLGIYLTENGYAPGGGLIGLNCLNGQVAVYNDGDWECGNSGLAADGLVVVSNGLLSNQFVDAFSSENTPVPIKDFYPPGVQDVIAVPDVGVGQSIKVCVSISNSFTPDVQVTLKDPTGAEYNLFDGEEIIGGLSKCYPDDAIALPLDGAPPFEDWFNKNPVGFWSLTVIDQGFNDVDFDGAIESWSIQMQTLSNKKVQATNDFYVQGDAYINGAIKSENAEVVIAGDLRVTGKITGPVFGATGDLDNIACDAQMKGQIRNYSGIFQWCNGSVWSKMNGATYRWTVFATHDNYHNQWAADNRAELFGGVAPSTWTDGCACANQMTDNFNDLRGLITHAGPVIGSLINAKVHSSRRYDYSSTNGHMLVTLFRVHNSTNEAITWNIQRYETSHGGWSEARSMAVNGNDVFCSCDNNGPSHHVSNDVSIPPNRTSTVIMVASTGGDQGSSRFLQNYIDNGSLALPDGLEFVDDFDIKPNGWDN